MNNIKFKKSKKFKINQKQNHIKAYKNKIAGNHNKDSISEHKMIEK